MGDAVACLVKQRPVVLPQELVGKYEFGFAPFAGGVVGRQKLFRDKAERGRVFVVAGGHACGSTACSYLG